MSFKREILSSADIQELLIGESLSDLQSDRWIGEINGKGGSARNLSFKVSAYLNISSSMIEGSGSSHGPAKNFSSVGLHFSGKRAGGKIMIFMWAEVAFMKGVPFVCCGHIFPKSNLAEAELIKGAFTLDCFTGCGCGGASGDFFLERRNLNSSQKTALRRD